MRGQQKAGYHAVMDEVRAEEVKGIDPYDMCIASELSCALSERMAKSRMKKTLKSRFEKDAERLFEIASSLFSKSAGACSPKDAAYGAVACYCDSGMDAKAAEDYTKCSEFAMRYFCRA